MHKDYIILPHGHHRRLPARTKQPDSRRWRQPSNRRQAVVADALRAAVAQTASSYIGFVASPTCRLPEAHTTECPDVAKHTLSRSAVARYTFRKQTACKPRRRQ